MIAETDRKKRPTMSENPENIAQIEAHRAQIDALDRQIVDLLNARARQSLAIRALKPGAGMNLYDPAREERIFQKLAVHNEGPLRDEDLRTVYETLLTVMRSVPAPESDR